MGQDTSSVLFSSSIISLACTSDTHNDVLTNDIAEADIFLHAGDMTDNGTLEELKSTFDWIAALPHQVKVIIAGNADYGLDPKHQAFSEEAHSLFTSPTAQDAGIHYLDREVREVAQYRAEDGSIRSLWVYGNPCQPAFEEYGDCFTYLPYPHSSAAEAWRTAPLTSDQANADIWLTHSPPKGRLDRDIEPPATGCEVIARCLARARPLLAIFGHIHAGYGVEKVTWDLMADKPNLSEMLSAESKNQKFDLSEPDMLDKDLNTLFVNAAWMTTAKRQTEKRNKPWLIKIDFDTSKC